MSLVNINYKNMPYNKKQLINLILELEKAINELNTPDNKEIITIIERNLISLKKQAKRLND